MNPGKKSGKPLITTNMASKSIVEELYDKITEEGYREDVAPLSIDDKLPDHIFMKLKTSMKGRYRFSYEQFSNRRGTVKPNGIFELFVKYCGDTIDKIRERLTDYVHSNIAEVKKMSAEYFKKKGGDLAMWLYRMSRPTTAGDELTLFLLCKIFTRHAVIHTLKGPWSTLNVVKSSVGSIEDRCDIVLVYIVFGFCEATKIDIVVPSQTVTVATDSSTKPKTRRPKKARSTLSITELLSNVHEKELKEQETIQNRKHKHRKLGLDEDNVLPTGYKKYNTREPTPVRKRQNERTKRDSVKNKCYSDNLDDYHLEGPKRRRKQNMPSRLRSPSRIRVEAQLMIKAEKQGHKVLGTIKNEDNDEKPKVKLEESEMRRIEARNKERNKQKKWPHDAKLVHIDGTPCSAECMKTSDYHKDMDEHEFNRISCHKQNEKLTVATPNLNIVDNANITNVPNSESKETSTQIQLVHLTVATPVIEKTNPTNTIDMDTEDTVQQGKQKQLTVVTPTVVTPTQKESTPIEGTNTTNKIDNEHCDVTNDTLSIDPDTSANPGVTQESECEEPAKDQCHLETNNMFQDASPDTEHDWTILNKNNSNRLPGATSAMDTMKKYDIDKSSTGKTESHELPEIPGIPENTTGGILPNIVPTIDCDLLTPVNPQDVTLPTDDLPLLEHNEILDDFEMLMNLDNDLDNTHLMTVDDEPIPDVTREMNIAAGVNQDLEIAMDNARFIDETLKGNVAPTSSNSNTISKRGIPVSPKGSFKTRTHGIRKLTPEERKDKKFKCDNCDFIAYSRKGVSNHYTEKHGSCICEYCNRYFGNPHALKRHQYEHSTDKQYKCKDCYQEFYFQSELTAHRMKHRENPSFTCMASGCGKKFFRNSDLNAHIPVHSGVLHRCDHPGCTYSNLDKRLVTGHKRVHSDKKTFMCKYEDCDETFKHTNARLRHYKRDH